VSGNKIRLFVAVDIPGEVRELLSRVLQELRGEMEGARWVKPENLHLTLKFIGDYEEEGLEKLTGEVRAAAERIPAFIAALDGCGAFPSGKRARVIWVGMAEGSEKAGRMARKLDARLERAGVKREDRPFKSHLTLARLKQPGDCSGYLKILNHKLEGLPGLPFEVGEVVLYRSILSPHGPTYVPLERISLGGG